MNPSEKLSSPKRNSVHFEIQTQKIEIVRGTGKPEKDSPPFCLNEEERCMKPMAQRREDIEKTLEWLKKQLKFLQEQDQNLMRQFLKLRGMLNSTKALPPLSPVGRKISLPEDAISAYRARRLSECTAEQLYSYHDYRRRSHSVFGERLLSFSSMTSESSMEELSEG